MTVRRSAMGGSGGLRTAADLPANGFSGDPVETVDIVVYTAAWATDHPAAAGEQVVAQLHSRVFVNGEELRCASAIRVDGAGGDFVTAQITVFPRSVEFYALNKEEWESL